MSMPAWTAVGTHVAVRERSADADTATIPVSPARRCSEGSSKLPGWVEGLTERTALGRLGQADDVAETIIAVLEMSWVTGQTVLRRRRLGVTQPNRRLRDRCDADGTRRPTMRRAQPSVSTARFCLPDQPSDRQQDARRERAISVTPEASRPLRALADRCMPGAALGDICSYTCHQTISCWIAEMWPPFSRSSASISLVARAFEPVPDRQRYRFVLAEHYHHGHRAKRGARGAPAIATGHRHRLRRRRRSRRSERPLVPSPG